MTRDFLIATLTALGLTGCGPDLSAESPPPANAGATAEQRDEAGRPGEADAAVARAELRDFARPGASDGREDDEKEGGEKNPR
jgi:hypothetical protein